MRKFIWAIMLVLIWGSLCPLPSLADSIDAPNRILTIAGDLNFPPYEYVDDEGEYRGFNVDLMRAISIEMGIEIKLIPMDWVKAYKALELGNIDAIQGINFDESHLSVFDFSEPYLRNSVTTFVSKDNTYAISIKDLKGRRVGVQRSDKAAYILADEGEIELMFFSDLNQAMVRLIKGDVDAVVGDRLSGLYTIQKYRLNDKVKIIGEEYAASDYGIAVKKGNVDLLERFDAALAALKKSGIYDKIYEKWFGKDLSGFSDTFRYAFYFLLALIGVVLSVLVIIYGWNKRLKTEVELRTHELKEAQRILRESDQFKRQVMENLGNGLMTFDRSGRLTTINQIAFDILPELTDPIGQPIETLNIDVYFDLEKIEKCTSIGQAFSLEEQRFMKNGKEMVYSYTLSPLVGEENDHIGCVLTFRNITEITQLRAKVFQQDKFQSLGRMLSGIAHEIRNPLTAIKTYLELLPLKYDNPTFRSKIVNQVPEEISRLNQLLTELLDYSKGKKPQPQAFSMSELLQQSLELIMPEFEKRNISVQATFNDHGQTLADRSHVKQIMLNLLINGMEAVESDGLIQIVTDCDETMSSVTIKDSGAGISKEQLDDIFEPFYTTKETGTGLGLAIVYQYVKENSGQITVQSQQGEGTQFDLQFIKAHV